MIKQWFKKTIAEFMVSLLISLFLVLVGTKFGVRPGEVIKVGNAEIPLFFLLVLFFYRKLFCTFPKASTVTGGPRST